MLKPMKKLENKSKSKDAMQIDDGFQQSGENIMQKFKANQDLYQKYGYYVIIAVVGILMYFNYMNENEREANGAFGIAMLDYTNNNTEEARQKFENLLLDYDGTEAGSKANYMLGKIYFDQNIIAQALVSYLAYDGSDPLFKAASKAGAAECYEFQKNYLEAAEAYLSASKDDERIQSSLYYKYSAALNYERAKDIETAKSLYQEILNSDVDFDKKSLVELKLGLL